MLIAFVFCSFWISKTLVNGFNGSPALADLFWQVVQIRSQIMTKEKNWKERKENEKNDKKNEKKEKPSSAVLTQLDSNSWTSHKSRWSYHLRYRYLLITPIDLSNEQIFG